MKKRTFLLFFMCLFSVASVFAESPDLPLFEEEDSTPAEAPAPAPCPLCDKRGKLPNIGNDAKSVDSIYLAPPPFPAVNVTMTSDQPLPSRPFEGVNMSYEGRYSADVEHPNRVSAPVDFAATQSAKKTVNVQIKEAKAEDDKAKDEKEVEEKKEDKESKKETAKTPDKKEDKEQAKKVNPVFPMTPIRSDVPTAPKKTVSSVASFDIATMQLGMTPDDVIDSATENGFEITNVAYGIPSFMVTNFERECRSSGLYQTRLIHECVRERAREEDVYYISQLVFKKAETKEQIVVLFSSTLTDNKAFKIDYTGYGDNSLGTSYKDMLKKTNRRDVFWKYVYDKYGRSNGNGNALVWGNPNGVFMRAFLQGTAMDGRIILEDASQKGVDYRQAENWNKEQEIINPFSF